MNREEVEQYLTGDQIKHIAEPDSRQREQLRDLLRHPGMAVLLGLMLAAREGFRAQLENWPARDMGTVQTLGVLQGKAQTLDILRQIVLECASAPAPETKD